MPCDYRKYPSDWKSIRAFILERAGNRCEACGVENHTNRQDTYIVLTIAHIDHDVNNNDPGNLQALCQRCHLRYDQEQHLKTRAENKRKAIERTGQMRLIE